MKITIDHNQTYPHRGGSGTEDMTPEGGVRVRANVCQRCYVYIYTQAVYNLSTRGTKTYSVKLDWFLWVQKLNSMVHFLEILEKRWKNTFRKNVNVRNTQIKALLCENYNLLEEKCGFRVCFTISKQRNKLMFQTTPKLMF